MEAMAEALSAGSLAHFIGTQEYHSHWLGVLLTDGVKFVFDNGAGWLVDAVASYQQEAKVQMNRRLQEIQFWSLEWDEECDVPVLRCREDSGEEPVISQVIKFTDFPKDLMPFKIWVEGKVMLLPGEH